MQIERFTRALQTAVQDVRDVREGVAASRAVRLFFFGFWFLVFFFGERSTPSKAARRSAHATQGRSSVTVRRFKEAVGSWCVVRGGRRERRDAVARIKNQKKNAAQFLKTPNRPISLFCTRPPDLDGGMTGARVSRVPRLTSTWDARKRSWNLRSTRAGGDVTTRKMRPAVPDAPRTRA